MRAFSSAVARRRIDSVLALKAPATSRLLACLIPARRALVSDPVTALRAQ
jgi:ABC-type lipoprotein release transport system permease subunit